MSSYRIIKIFFSTTLIIVIVFIFDLLVNVILSENFKKKIGTTRNYSLKSIKFHHEIASNIDLYEYWGNKKYKVVTNQYSMRVLNKDKREIKKNKENIGFVGDSFVYGSGINYEDHFINILDNNNFNYNFLNLGYVSYSPSIYYKKIKYFLEVENLNFDKIFLFVDHSDVQDEGLFYRENSDGNIIRKWHSDEEAYKKNKKYILKNFLKQNSFIFKIYEHFVSPKISNNSKKCVLDNYKKNYINYMEVERFGYGYDKEIYKKKWVNEGLNKISKYLNEILFLSKKYNFKLFIVYYPSAMEVLDKIHYNSSKHFVFLKEWSVKNNVNFINTYDEFNQFEDNKKNYLQNFIECDVHWNVSGHLKISKILSNIIDD